MRFPAILICLLLLSTSIFAQEKDTLRHEGKTPYYYGYYSVSDSCVGAIADAKELYSKGDFRYLIPMQFGASEDDIARSVILEKQYGIKPCMVGISCFGTNSKLEAYQCYNKTMDSLFSNKLQIDFKKQLDQKVDIFLKRTTTKKLRKQYGYF